MSLRHPFELRAIVQSYFAEHDYECPVYWGWDEASRQDTRDNDVGRRIVFELGDDRGAAGTYGPAKQPGRPQRTLLVWRFLFQCSLWAIDKTDPESAELQAAAICDLHQWFIRALANAASGRLDTQYELRDPAWLAARNSWGRTLRIPLLLDFPQLDVAPGVVRASPALTFKTLPGGNQP